ncbi:GNAT family N-acetyltransferase [Sinomonas sp. ASV486]|uniref:GNAT family N-acetyltransferase n=1 Tax=Sinomonas sp. ASV486 TaxID=3051170 RepID=UPI0027DAFBA7|nr:GNAT family N-acetyltransferase [Sinomonas sp. ASV486]MDQ4489298.1 GNAT family N-acetyltransferase [Sinomonas sp. ASV486]
MQTHPKLMIRRAPWSNPVGRDLRAAQQAELDARYGDTTHEPGSAPSAADLAIFLIAYERSTGQPLGCGGLRWVAPTTAEVKRVYVLPYARGAGIASSILTALEAEAHTSGITLVLAEAGSAQPDGKMFYESAGYRRIPNFGPYQELDESLCYGKPVMNPVRVHAVAG